jgi:hypothetical protein
MEHGVKKVGQCQGSFICQNPNCAFLEAAGKANCQNFVKEKGSKTVRNCFTCACYATHVPCAAKKVTEWDPRRGVLTIYHMGTHQCTVKKSEKHDTAFIQEAIKAHSTLGPKRLTLELMKSALEKGDLDQVDDIAKKLSNPTKIRNEKYRMKQDTFPDRNSFEAVSTLKRSTDKKDKFHIYKMNPPNMNEDVPFVFKTSREMAQLAIAMQNEAPFCDQKKEEVFFDGTHSRVVGYKTLTLWCYDVAQRRLLNLASMEVKSEDTRYITLFFKLFNEVLTEVYNEGKAPGEQIEWYHFNPCAVMCDENGANFKGMEAELPGVKLVSCQMHYKTCAIQKSPRVSLSDRATFLQLVKDICTCHTVNRYQKLSEKLQELASRNEAIQSWIAWWDARKYHVVPAYRDFGYKGCNLAEIGHSTLKKLKNQTLLDAVMFDVCRMKLQDRTTKEFLANRAKSYGRGPTQLQAYGKSWKEQMERAKQFAEVLDNDEWDQELDIPEDPFSVKASSSHRAPPKKRKHGLQGKMVGSKKKTATKRGWKKIPDAQLECLDAQPAIREPLIVHEVAPPCRAFPQHTNPPMLCRRYGNIRRCQGCPEDIDAKKDFWIFRMMAIKPFPEVLQGVKTGRWIYRSVPQPVYFHMRMSCLQAHNSLLEAEEISASTVVINSITDQDEDYLNEHFPTVLRHVMKNYNKKSE